MLALLISLVSLVGIGVAVISIGPAQHVHAAMCLIGASITTATTTAATATAATATAAPGSKVYV